MALKVLYHGTDASSAKSICTEKNIDVHYGAKETDFGKGFYTTDNYDYAVRWAYRNV